VLSIYEFPNTMQSHTKAVVYSVPTDPEIDDSMTIAEIAVALGLLRKDTLRALRKEFAPIRPPVKRGTWIPAYLRE
jgi:hypothetical protein